MQRPFGGWPGANRVPVFPLRLLGTEGAHNLRMSPRGHRQKETLHKVERSVSPDDVKFLLLERDRQAAQDTRTDAQKWLGDPAPNRSALAQPDRR
jgi:hypothetical protein